MFLSVDQFEALKTENIMKWRDVPTGIIYKIETIEEIKTKKGPATVISLVDCNGLRYRTWATGMLSRDLKNRTGKLFIKPLKKKESTKNPGQFYYDYELVEQPDSDDEEDYDVVEKEDSGLSCMRHFS